MVNIKFFCYHVDSGEIFACLSELPDNANTMEETGDIVHEGRFVARGVKFFKNGERQVGLFYHSVGFPEEELEHPVYVNGEIIDGK